VSVLIEKLQKQMKFNQMNAISNTLYKHYIKHIILNVRKTGKPDRNENLGLRTGQESVLNGEDRTGIPF
jgi:hypothetical protein